MLFSKKENVFMCLVAFQKMFRKIFLMFGCVFENTIENTFSTCCSHFLTFSRLPNDYIMSFIPQNTNKTKKKIIKSGQTKARSRSERSWLEWSAHRAIAIAIDVFARCVNRDSDRAKIKVEIAIGATAPTNDCNRDRCVHAICRSR